MDLATGPLESPASRIQNVVVTVTEYSRKAGAIEVGGTLVHSKEFIRLNFIGNDGTPHFELDEVDGDSENCAHASWREIQEIALLHGVPKAVWPALPDCECCIDVSLEVVRSLQYPFRDYILQLPPEVLSSHPTLYRIANWLRNEELVFFCMA